MNGFTARDYTIYWYDSDTGRLIGTAIGALYHGANVGDHFRVDGVTFMIKKKLWDNDRLALCFYMKRV